jgi:hypothetical protein
MTDEYSGIKCCDCGIAFGVPPVWDKARRNDHRSFYCPNGHSLSYKGESEAEKLRRERDLLKQLIAEKNDDICHEREKREAAERQLAAQKGQVTKLKKRAAAGVCPCCNRTFSQLAAHMRQKHPTYLDPATKDMMQ